MPFCYDIEVSAGQLGPTGANPGSPGSLPLTSLTAGATPSGVANYSIQNVNLTTGTAQLCGTNNNTAASAPVTMAPVATNSAGSATDSIPLWSQNECTWSSTGATDSMFDPNQDLEQAGSQSAFGQPITNGVTGGTTKDEPTCTGGVGVSASGGLGDAWTMNTSNPLPTPTDSNPSAALGDLPSSNLDLTSATSGAVGGCYGATNILASTSTSAFGTNTASMTLPSTWVNGGNCSYSGLGSNSAGGNTDTAGGTNGGQPATGDANCPPNQADVNAGLVSCGVVLSSGNDENGSTNYSSVDLFYNGQPVPQTPTATLSTGSAQAGGTVSVTTGSNWFGARDGAPNAGPYGDFQNDAANFYPVSAPQVFIGTSRGTAVPVSSSTVTVSAVSYACTGAESTTVGPNPCTLTPGKPTGTFQVPAGLAEGAYNVYIDESNTTPLPGNGPNDSYQTARGTNLGTAESVTQLVVGAPVFTSAASASFNETTPGTFAVTTSGGTNPISFSETGVLPSGVTLAPNGTLSGTPAFGTAGSYPITITATDGDSITSTQAFTLTVTPTAPVFTSGTSTTFAENSPGTFAVTANGDTPIGYTETGALPSGVTLATNGTLSGTPAFGTAGSYPITITATDTHNTTSTQAFTLTVTASAPVFTSAASTTFTENSAGTFAVTANGDTPIGYTETGALPSGVTLASNGTLSGTPAFNTAGSYPITITATDANSNTATQAFTLNVSIAVPVFTSATSTTFAENSAGTFAVTAIGYTPIGFTETGALPSGVTLAPNGTLSGTPAFGTAGSYPITITATDTNSNTTTQAFTLTVTASAPVFTSGTSTTFAENSAGTFAVTANGDTPIGYTETGALPSGVTLATNGTLSGTPAFNTAGSYPITITATDVNANTSTQAFTLTVTASAPVFTSGTSTTFAENSAGTFAVTANGDTPIGYTETGALPSGVTLATNGTLSGTPAFNTAGSYPITITATDTNSNTTTQAFTLTVTASAPVFTSAASTTFTETSAGTFAVTANGDTPIGFTETGALPSGVTLATNGTLSGTPAFGTAGSYPITITATDTNANTTTQAFTLTVAAAAPVFTSAASTTFAENSAGTFAVTATGHTPIGFTETGALPSGVTLAPDGTLSGTPAFGTAGSYPITITATDTNSNTTTQAFTLTVTASAPVFTSAASISFAENSAGTFAVTATGDTPIGYTETGALPSGVTLAPDGTLSGTPALGTAGHYPITITATDTNSNTTTQAFTLTVAFSVPVFTSGTSATFAENSAGTFAVTATGDTPIGYTETGALPSGVTLAPDGTLSGTPAFNSAGSYPITITATDVNANTSTQTFTLTVTASAPVFTSGTSTTFTETSAGTFAVTANGDTPIGFTETGALPSGVTLATNGTLSGTPAFGTAGSYPITITATDANANTSTQAFTLTVAAAAPVFTSAASTTFTETSAGTFAVTATGHTPIGFTETGALPSGVTLATNGTLSGTPAFGTAGSYPITITATDANANTSTQAFTLTVAASAPVFTSAASTTFTENNAGTFAVTATGHTPIGFTETGALPSGVTLAPDGTLSGTPALGTAGSYPITITATDTNSNTTTQAFTLTVNHAPTTAVLIPSTGAVLHGTSATLDATAASGVGISKVQFVITGGSYNKAVVGTAVLTYYGYLYIWNTTTVPGGTYTLQSVATDTGGNTGYSAGISITVDNTPPTTSVLVPSTGAILHGTAATLDATAAASYGVGITKVQFAITGGSYNQSVVGTSVLTPYGYIYQWNTTTVPGGTYTVQSLATDGAGNTAYSSPISVTVDNTPPTTSVLRPLAASVLHGTAATLDATAAASYGVGITKVQFVITGGSYNQSVVGTSVLTLYGYIYQWNTTTVPSGTYTVQSLATDGAGNTAYSSPDLGDRGQHAADNRCRQSHEREETDEVVHQHAHGDSQCPLWCWDHLRAVRSDRWVVQPDGHRHGNVDQQRVGLPVERHRRPERHLHAAEPGH